VTHERSAPPHPSGIVVITQFAPSTIIAQDIVGDEASDREARGGPEHALIHQRVIIKLVALRAAALCDQFDMVDISADPSAQPNPRHAERNFRRRSDRTAFSVRLAAQRSSQRCFSSSGPCFAQSVPAPPVASAAISVRRYILRGSGNDDQPDHARLPSLKVASFHGGVSLRSVYLGFRGAPCQRHEISAAASIFSIEGNIDKSVFQRGQL